MSLHSQQWLTVLTVTRRVTMRSGLGGEQVTPQLPTVAGELIIQLRLY